MSETPTKRDLYAYLCAEGPATLREVADQLYAGDCFVARAYLGDLERLDLIEIAPLLGAVMDQPRRRWRVLDPK